MISISLSFAKLAMMPSALAKFAVCVCVCVGGGGGGDGDARYASQDAFIRCPIQSRLRFALGVRSF